MKIIGNRVVLRPLSISDALAMHQIFSSEIVTKYLFMNPTKNFIQSQRLLKTNYLSYYRLGLLEPYAITLKNKEVIGLINIHTQRTDNIGEIGFMLNDKYHGLGLMHESINLYLKHLFAVSELTRIELMHKPENIACAALALKCGFHYEGELRGFYQDDEGYDRSLQLYSYLKSDQEEENI